MFIENLNKFFFFNLFIKVVVSVNNISFLVVINLVVFVVFIFVQVYFRIYDKYIRCYCFLIVFFLLGYYDLNMIVVDIFKYVRVYSIFNDKRVKVKYI